MKSILLGTVYAVLLCLALSAPSSCFAAPRVTHVSAGGSHTLFVESDGSLWVTGDNSYGELGLGFSPGQTNVPQQIVASNVTAIAAGGLHSLFLESNGSLWVMGDNRWGQLGDGTTTGHYFPEQIVAGGVTTIDGGLGYSLFKTVTGHLPFLTTGLWGMGANFAGELGDGTNTDRHLPELLQSALFGTPTEIADVAAGISFSLYRRRDGSLWAMGYNLQGQLGDGTDTNRYSPVQVVASGVTKVAAGGYHSLFLKSDGGLWAMGSDLNGQLGDNLTSDHFVPEQIGVKVTAIAAGDYHSLFIRSDGSLWAMGHNNFGQLGDGTTTDRHLPVQIVGSNVIAVTAGEGHSLFIKSDGTLWAMGNNSQGQLGDGTYTNRYSPVQVVPLVILQPRIANFTLVRTNLVMTGTNGQSGRTYCALMSTNLGRPLNQWTPVATNVLSADGNFTITAPIPVIPNAPQRFYILQTK